MRWDPDAQEWVAENRGLNQHGMPAKGIPGTYGYDANGDQLPYANHRPDYTEKVIKDVWDASRNNQLQAIDSGDLALPTPGENQMWVKVRDHETGSELVNLGRKGEWRLIEWEPGMSRNGAWDMGHKYNARYDELLSRYLTPGNGFGLEEFLEEYRTVGNYSVEDPGRNRSHVDEKPPLGGRSAG